MLPQLNKIKGLHPGIILKRELSRQDIRSSELADAINEHKQTISAILNQRRGINPSISIKLAKRFNIAEDYFMLLQASYDVKEAAKQVIIKQPNINNFRKVIFWDTTIDKIDWDKNKKAVIKRILERGNETEINEIISFYGKKTISREIKTIKKSYLPTFEHNARAHNLI
ncbi:HigA family addiction module antitoxin [Lutibacter sp.]|uniref:HigA family addiction module antitoxin n=1 Tax=Lutibacter sp. TaxID=1925666 RepID=UPI00356AC090